MENEQHRHDAQEMIDRALRSDMAVVIPPKRNRKEHRFVPCRCPNPMYGYLVCGFDLILYRHHLKQEIGSFKRGGAARTAPPHSLAVYARGCRNRCNCQSTPLPLSGGWACAGKCILF